MDSRSKLTTGLAPKKIIFWCIFVEDFTFFKLLIHVGFIVVVVCVICVVALCSLGLADELVTSMRSVMSLDTAVVFSFSWVDTVELVDVAKSLRVINAVTKHI